MKLSKLIADLKSIYEDEGDVDVFLASPVSTKQRENWVYDEMFYTVPERYDPDEDHKEPYAVVNIRSWLY